MRILHYLIPSVLRVARSFFVLLPVVYGMIAFNTVSAQPPQMFDDISLKELISVLDVRADSRNPIWLAATITWEETIDFSKKKNEPNELKWQAHTEIAKKGIKYHSSMKREKPTPKGMPLEIFTIYNGHICVTKASPQNSFIVTEKNQDIVHGACPLEITGEPRLRNLLSQIAKGEKKAETMSIKTEVQKGERLVVVHIKLLESGWVHRYTLNPEFDNAVVRWEILNKQGGFVDRGEAWNYQAFAGHMIALDGKQIHFMKGNKIGYSIAFHITSCKTHASEVPDHLFYYDLPPDATVFDADKGLTLRNSAVSKHEWDEIVRLIGPPKSLWGSWSFWVSLLASLAVFAVALVTWRRWKKKQRKDTPSVSHDV